MDPPPMTTRRWMLAIAVFAFAMAFGRYIKLIFDTVERARGNR